MNKKNISIWAVVLLVIIAGGFLVWKSNQEVEVSQQQNQVENQEQNQEVEIDTIKWKTYKDDKYGFEIKYPKYWEIKESGTNAFGGEWLSVVINDNQNVVMQINRRILMDSDPLQWIKDNMILNSIGGGQKMEVEEFMENNPNIYAFHIKLDNREMYIRHRYLISNKKSMIYFNFEEINRNRDSVSQEIKETNFSQYLPEFEVMVHSIKFFD